MRRKSFQICLLFILVCLTTPFVFAQKENTMQYSIGLGIDTVGVSSGALFSIPINLYWWNKTIPYSNYLEFTWVNNPFLQVVPIFGPLGIDTSIRAGYMFLGLNYRYNQYTYIFTSINMGYGFNNTDSEGFHFTPEVGIGLLSNSIVVFAIPSLTASLNNSPFWTDMTVSYTLPTDIYTSELMEDFGNFGFTFMIKYFF
jgi:hypothetical protein